MRKFVFFFCFFVNINAFSGDLVDRLDLNRKNLDFNLNEGEEFLALGHFELAIDFFGKRICFYC